MTDIEHIRQQSHTNLQALLKNMQKFKVKYDMAEVELVVKSIPIYHATRGSNIIDVIKTQTLLTKNQVVMGEHTNMSTDFYQGFENNVSMSIGEPWIEYGPYVFTYGLEHINPDSPVFCDDPWLWKTEKFQKNVLLRDDFAIYAREMLARNLKRVSGKIYIQIPWKTDLHELARTNFRRWELKQQSSLSILDAEEFFVWSNFDAFAFEAVRLLGNPIILAGLGVILGLLVYAKVTA